MPRVRFFRPGLFRVIAAVVFGFSVIIIITALSSLSPSLTLVAQIYLFVQCKIESQIAAQHSLHFNPR